MMGDNRDNSTDSREQSPRYGVGYVPLREPGRPRRDHLLLCRRRRSGRLPADESWTWPFDIRWGRFFSLRALMRSRTVAARSASSRTSRRRSATLQESGAAREGADACQRAPGNGQAPRQRAARVPGRPRAGPRRRRAPERALSRRPARASSPASTTGWCAAAPAPRWRARSISARRCILSESKPAAAAATRRRSWPTPARRCWARSFSTRATRRRATVVRAHWGAKLEGSPAEAADAKSALQEWAQGQGLDLPQYVEVARKGPDHAPRFTSEVRIKGTQARARRGRQQARRRAGRRHGAAGARRRAEGHR